MSKKLFYKGVFNLRCEMDVMYAWAYSQKQAWSIFCRRMADKHTVPIGTVMEIFEQGKENYRISIETNQE